MTIGCTTPSQSGFYGRVLHQMVLERSKPFYSWAGHSIELPVMGHMPQLADALRIEEYEMPFSWSGETPDTEKTKESVYLDNYDK